MFWLSVNSDLIRSLVLWGLFRESLWSSLFRCSVASVASCPSTDSSQYTILISLLQVLRLLSLSQVHFRHLRLIAAVVSAHFVVLSAPGTWFSSFCCRFSCFSRFHQSIFVILDWSLLSYQLTLLSYQLILLSCQPPVM